MLKVAVTFVAALIATWQGPVPEQLPDQPPNIDPGAGSAVSVTALPSAKAYEHFEPQSIPAGELVTLPEPTPPSETESLSLAISWTSMPLVVAPRLTETGSASAQDSLPL